MAKKDLASLTTDLSALAAGMPTQRPTPAAAPSAAPPVAPTLKVVEAPKSLPEGQGEEIAQFSLSLRKGLRKQLARLADDADVTMRAFVLNALKEKGLDVRPDDLIDLRKERR
jgi:hypothetical protein